MMKKQDIKEEILEDTSEEAEQSESDNDRVTGPPLGCVNTGQDDITTDVELTGDGVNEDHGTMQWCDGEEEVKVKVKKQKDDLAFVTGKAATMKDPIEQEECVVRVTSAAIKTEPLHNISKLTGRR